MRKHSTGWSVALSFTFAAAGMTPPAVAKGPFTLLRAVPGDVFYCSAHRHNAERDFLDAYWTEVFETAKQSGIAADLLAMIAASLNEEQKAEADRIKEWATEMIGKVEWGSLAEKELVFAQRMAMPVRDGTNVSMGSPDFVWLMRSEEAIAQKNFDGLVSVLQGLAGKINEAIGSEQVSIAVAPRGNAKVASINVKAASASKPAFSLALAVHHDTIAIVLGEEMLDEVLALLEGEGSKKPPLTHNARFKKAFSSLPEAEDKMSFFDMQAMLGAFRALADGIIASQQEGTEKAGTGDRTVEQADGPDSASATKPSAGGNESAQWKRLADRLLGVPGMMDYCATVGLTEGYSTHEESVMVLAPGADKNAFYPVLAARKQLRSFDRYLPRETTSFSVGTGIDWGALYDFLEETVRGFGDQGGALLGQWQMLQTQYGLDLRKDVLGILDGGVTSMSLDLPGGEAWVVMVKVNEADAAREKVASALSFLSTSLQQAAQKNPMLGMVAVRTSPTIHEKLSGFQNVQIPVSPQPLVWGVADDYVIIGSSADAVALCLETAEGRHLGIRENQRVMAEAALPIGPIRSISFTDQRQFGQKLSQMLSGVSMMGGMAAMAIPDPENQKRLSRILSMVMKLAPVARKIDFYKSTASYSTFDGRVWRTKRVANYQSPEERGAAGKKTE